MNWGHSLFMLGREVILLLALGPFIYYLASIWACVAHFHRVPRAVQNPCGCRPISILKPVHGLDHEAYRNFASFCRQDYPEYEVLFCVSSLSDPSFSVLRKIQKDFPERRIRLLIGAPAIGTCDKLNKLCRLVKEARYDLLVISDSDIRVDASYLLNVEAPFADSGVGAVTVLFRSIADGGLGSLLDAAGSAVEFASSALLAQRLEGIRFTLGFTMATTKSRLVEIGGFEAFASHSVDDYELGRRISRRGYRVELANAIVSMVYPRERLSEFLRHQLRWTIGLRSVRPGGHAAMIFTFGLPWTILAASCASSVTVALAYIVGYLSLRIATYLMLGVWALKDAAVKRYWWLAPVRDMANFGIWVMSFFTNRIRWRGVDFRIDKGQLVPLGTPQSRKNAFPAANTRLPV